MGVLVCGQNIVVYFNFFLNPARRPQDDLRQRRGEGELLLCVEKMF